MKRSAKLWVMFAPLALLFMGLFTAIDDLKHPDLHLDTCRVLGTGPAMAKLNNGHNQLYAHSDSPIYDVGFQCRRMGTVLLNDHEPFKRSLAPGDKATILHKTFRYLPEIWRVEVKTHLTDSEKALL